MGSRAGSPREAQAFSHSIFRDTAEQSQLQASSPRSVEKEGRERESLTAETCRINTGEGRRLLDSLGIVKNFWNRNSISRTDSFLFLSIFPSFFLSLFSFLPFLNLKWSKVKVKKTQKVNKLTWWGDRKPADAEGQYKSRWWIVYPQVKERTESGKMKIVDDEGQSQ